MIPEEGKQFSQNWQTDRNNTAFEHEKLLYPKLAPFEDGDFRTNHKLRTEYDFANAKVLDIGCGDGSFLSKCALLSPQFLAGFDINPHLVEIASVRNPSAQLTTCDASDIWPSFEVDFTHVFCLNVIMHLDNVRVRQLFTQATKVVRANCLFTVAFVHFDWANRQYPLFSVGDNCFCCPGKNNNRGIDEFHRPVSSVAKMAMEAGFYKVGEFPVKILPLEGLGERYRPHVGKNLFHILHFRNSAFK